MRLVIELEAPDELAKRIIASNRRAYPDLTKGKNDQEAVKAVIKYQLAQTLVEEEGRTAVGDARAEVEERGRKAREKAWNDAAGIT